METLNELALIPTSISTLIFPSASHNFSHTLTSLKKSTLCITNRLNSIHQDSIFVQQLARACNLPLIANERCGSWYISPEHKAGSAYFKSTDGHQGQWAFSKRRLNLQLLDIVEEHKGYAMMFRTSAPGNIDCFGKVDASLLILRDEENECQMLYLRQCQSGVLS